MCVLPIPAERNSTPSRQHARYPCRAGCIVSENLRELVKLLLGNRHRHFSHGNHVNPGKIVNFPDFFWENYVFIRVQLWWLWWCTFRYLFIRPMGMLYGQDQKRTFKLASYGADQNIGLLRDHYPSRQARR